MMEKLTNLYEVIKTIKFELKPSEFTLKRCSFDSSFESDPHVLFEKLKPIHKQQKEILNILSNLPPQKIVIHKNLIKLIDSDYFYRLKSKALSANNTLVVLSKEFQEEFSNYIKEKFDRLHSTNYSLSYLLWADSLEKPSNTDKKPTKSEIAFAVKRYVHAVQKVEEIISNIIYKTGNTDNELKTMLKSYYDNKDLGYIFSIANRYLQSYSPTSGFQVSKFGFNAKAIRKKVDVEKMEKEIRILETKMLDLEDKKVIATQIFDDYTKKFVQEKIKTDPKLVALRENQTASPNERKQAKEYLKTLKEGDFNYQKILKERSKAKKEQKKYEPKFTGDKEYCELKLAKIDASVIYGRAKGDFFAKQQELYSQQALSHYARLVRNGEKYFVVMIDRDNINELDNLGDNQIKNDDYFEILRYSSLTAKAVEKLIFEKNALNFNRYDKEYRDCKNIREKRTYKEKGSEDSRSITNDQKTKLRKLVSFLNEAITQLNKKVEGGVFNWVPFNISNEFDDFAEFRKYVTKTCYITKWESISKQIIYDLDKKGILDFYQIYNKDFAVDPYFAKTERDKNRIKKDISIMGKQNLFTIYWESLFGDNSSNIRLNPESNLYVRPAKVVEEISDHNPNYETSKLRYKENKIIGDFQLVFYPTKELPLDKLQKKILDEVDKSYAIGIDLGENSLATICLIDNEKRVVLDEEGKPIIKDLSMINNKGDFVELDDCYIDGQPYKRKQKLLVGGQGNKPYTLGRYFPEKFQNQVISKMSKETLIEVLKILEDIAPEKLGIVDNHGNKVFDYNYAFEHLKATNKIRYHLQAFDHTNEEMEILEKDLLASTKIRGGFVGKVVSYITQMSKKYNALIVFENLDQEIGRIRGMTLFSEQEYEKVSAKEERMYKGISPYQLIQDKIIQKCNYLLSKQDNTKGIQISPRLKRQEDIKQLTLLKDKNCAWGKVVFVNEENSSKECPECGFIPGKYSSNINIQENGIEIMANKKDKKLLLFENNPLLNERRIAYQSIPDTNELKKKSLLIETRVGKTILTETDMKIVGDPMICVNCGYDTRKEEWVKKYNLKSCDEIAAYIIAKRGLEFVENKGYENQSIDKPSQTNTFEENKKSKNSDNENSSYTMSGNINFSHS
ncbi:MAG TPA: hypothetical protein PK674_01455 [Candidatus Absconditabacterales bacterium]|nr:hypothetical protein [Candidatus Absconditabacterales bacterium]HOQ78933.1 hypothetical protein [Candidatus Absconditabacterales bacterium]HPK28129.1 hypothetical protein [Candidatus Absconditabacterales bacterium]